MFSVISVPATVCSSCRCEGKVHACGLSVCRRFQIFISFAVLDASETIGARLRAFRIPERCGQFEGSDSRGGEAQRVSVGDLLHGPVEALYVVSLQH